MAKIIITSGSSYVDVDAVASAFLYKDMLLAKGIEAEIVFPGPINSSVTKSMLDWGLNIKKDLHDENAHFIVVDVSEKSKLPSFVTDSKIDAIYDHRLMFLDDWKGKNINLVIEEVGACATLIWEEIKRNSLEDKITDVSLKLAFTAIFSNTLNFNAGVTTERDKKAFFEIEKLSGLNREWIKKYYQETESGIYQNIEESIRNDTKLMEVPGIGEKIAIGQMELWDSRIFVEKYKDVTKKVLSGISGLWFMTTPSISEGINYIYTESTDIKNILSDRIGAKFEGTDVGTTDKLWLRKEILKELFK